MFKYNSDPEIKELEKKALKINKEKTENLNYWYNSDFNKRTGRWHLLLRTQHSLQHP